MNVVLSDENGNIKWLDLTTFIRKPDAQNQLLTDDELLNAQDILKSSAPPYLKRVESYQEQKTEFMPNRRLDVTAGSLATSLLEIFNKKHKMPPLVLAAQSV